MTRTKNESTIRLYLIPEKIAGEGGKRCTQRTDQSWRRLRERKFWLRPIGEPAEEILSGIPAFLTKMNLTYNRYGVDYCIGAYHSDTNELLGTASLSGHVIHNIAVNPVYQKQGLTTALLSAIMSYGTSKHIFYFQLFTKPQNISLFCNAGFRLVEEASPYVALLEFGQQTPESWCRRIIRENNLSSTDSYAAIVMNCNPYTLGHKYLIEQAAAIEQNVLIFVVEENRSMLPFADRYRLMQEDLQNHPQIKPLPRSAVSKSRQKASRSPGLRS